MTSATSSPSSPTSAAGPSLGVDAWASYWVERNAAVGEPEIETPGARVWMPPHLGRVSRSIDASRFCWTFLAERRRRL